MKATDRRPLGKSGIEVTLLGLGGAPLGDLYEAIPEDRALATIETAYRLGVRLYDTAPYYGQGISEHRFGHVLRQRPDERDEIVLSTKIGRYMVPEHRSKVDHSVFKGGLDFRLIADYSYDGTMRALDQSWQRLGMNRIDIVHIHDVDVRSWGGVEAYEARFKEAADGAYKALDELRSAGVVGAIGVGVNEIEPLLAFSKVGDFDCFMLAGRYTLLEHAALDELLPLCETRGIGILTAGPYNSGILATGARPGAKYNYQPAPQDILDRVAGIEAVCGRHGVPLPAAAVQFPLAHPAISAMVPGAVRPEEVEANVKLVETPIPADFWAELKHEGLLRADAPTP
ncbi:aldo/keto reductase [Prosthecomicrobium pneumaticum]|uniref:D-threo-aldose 1-dehydrogenase n=1 Tax=Prosthecomicrobium pneumaticum TaxID=81895 RepID=A0A7W9FKU7_9HYPH|nr:aldo/keto reductase [Prosthecomicrobium pneumaticum]MBB5751603.1 D-threo-aldose 1-dehydrogenase [Prosthecomicrobium pneumaticum]